MPAKRSWHVEGKASRTGRSARGPGLGPRLLAEVDRDRSEEREPCSQEDRAELRRLALCAFPIISSTTAGVRAPPVSARTESVMISGASRRARKPRAAPTKMGIAKPAAMKIRRLRLMPALGRA